MKRISSLLPLIVALFALSIFAFVPNTSVSLAAGDASDPALYSNDWRTTGPPGGDVRALVVDPQNPDRFYFGTLDGQIYTSSDGGKRWQLLYNFGKPRMFVDEIIVDPRNSRVCMLAHTGTICRADSLNQRTAVLPGVRVLN